MTGCVVWLTGLPSSGKSTLGARIRDAARAAGLPVVLLDGDAVRDALVPRPGYTAEARDDFYATLARLAALFANDGAVAIVAATAHRRAYRERARALAPRFIEVHVDVDPAECARRDAKGLFAAVREGAARELPGADIAYEPPVAADVTASGGRDEAAAAAVLQLVAAGQSTD